MPRFPKRFLPTVLGILLLVVTDLLLKSWALSSLALQSPTEPLHGIVDLFLYKNAGVIGSIPIPLLVVIPASILLLGVCTWFLIRSNEPRKQAGLALILSGGLGNLLDRILHGFTTDYVILFERSVINAADLLLVVGILLVLIPPAKSSSPFRS